jgi:uncharacterized protein (DUF362 family)
MSKLKNHKTAGVTLSLKNSFGNTPCSLYGADCGESGNEDPKQQRGAVLHTGVNTPPKGVPQELDRTTPREGGYHLPRVIADLVGARPIHLSIVDGVESIRGGEGIWSPAAQLIKPGVLLAGKNPVCVDAVSAAVMGYDPLADRGKKPFVNGDNTMKLAQAVGIGTADLSRIEVTGLTIKEALCDYESAPAAKPA